MSATALASLQDVSKRFGSRWALQGLSLEIRAGEVLGLLGRNGAGKTTALRVLCGLLAPDAGTVRIDGHDLRRDPISAKKAIGYVPDGAPLYSNLTPLEHLEIVGRLHGLAPTDLRREAQRLLEAFELGGRGDEPVGGLSRGMRQKVALACALLPGPSLLVLDEPLTGLDTATALVVKALMRGWAARGRGVIVTSHLLEVVERSCDRMAVLSEGRLLACGAFDELRHQAGGGSTLEEVFRTLTRSEDPEAAASRILGV